MMVRRQVRLSAVHHVDPRRVVVGRKGRRCSSSFRNVQLANSLSWHTFILRDHILRGTLDKDDKIRLENNFSITNSGI